MDWNFSVTQLVQAVTSRKISPREIVQHFQKRSETFYKTLNSHISWDPACIQDQLDKVETRLSSGEKLPLAGIPVLVKDNISTKDYPTTCGSKILQNYRPVFDATVVDRLRNKGAILFGKANCDEFGMGSTNENSAFGPARNPWNLDLVPGGSSGGSAAAVAMELCPVALGTDTGGSIRQPASFCGIVGFKPTYGTVSRHGLIAYGSSLDQIGPMAGSVADAALILDMISGSDGMDGTCNRPAPTSAFQAIAAGKVRPKRVACLAESYLEGAGPAVRKALNSLVEKLREDGVIVEEVELKSLPYATSAYYIIATAEASSNLARFDGVRYGFRAEDGANSLEELYRKTRTLGFGKEVKQRILLGTFVLSAGYFDQFYGKACRARAIISRELAAISNNFDCLMLPTSPTTAFPLGNFKADPVSMYLSDIYTIISNLSGQPALNLPMALSEDGLPIGVQLMGAHQGDERLLQIGAYYEQLIGWSNRPRLGEPT